MNYLLDKHTIYKNKSQRRPTLIRAGLGALLMVILWLLGPLIFTATADRFADLSQGGLQIRSNMAGHADHLLASLKKDPLETSRRDLEQKTAQLSFKKEKLNKQLKNLEELEYQLKPVENEPTGVGKVLAGPGLLNYDILLVSIEKENPGKEIKVGQQVKVADYLSLGRIVSLEGNLARVKMYSSPNTKIKASLSPDNLPVTALGQGQGNWIIKTPINVPTEKGDQVMIATGPDQLLGLVQKIISDRDEASQKIFVSFPLNFYQLNWVEFYDI